MYFGKNLRYLRKIKELSQEDIADKLGYKSFTTIQKWESGDSEPPINKVRSICLIFNIPIEQMLNCDLEKSQDEILKRIQELLRYQNYQTVALTEFLDIADISYKEWSDRQSKTYMFYLPEISDFFGISIGALVGESKPFWALDGEQIEVSQSNIFPSCNNTPQFDEQKYDNSDYEILDKYHTLDEDGQNFVSLVLNREYDRCQSLPDQTLEENAGYNVIYLPYPDNRASAGTGDEFLSDVTRSISVKENRLTIRADLVIKVDGNSMEPVYSDGDMVLVHQQPAVDIGSIGLYAANGKGYIKKQGKDCLISVNPDYPDIMPEKNYAYKCFGQVIGKLNPEWII